MSFGPHHFENRHDTCFDEKARDIGSTHRRS